jgi:diadenosine tetraphosphate (Ap4A) HIT family hydrolase
MMTNPADPATPAMSTWSLHARLAHDTAPVVDLPLSRVLAFDDANYPWVVLVPRQAGISEIIDLDAAQRTQLMAEIAQVCTALKELTRCDKLNVGAIGNVVPQLHVHVVARRRDDAAWPKPVWGAVPARPYPAGELQRFVSAVQRALAIA